MTTIQAQERAALAEALERLHSMRKPHPSGSCGQTLGQESWRIVASGRDLACLLEAADALLATPPPAAPQQGEDRISVPVGASWCRHGRGSAEWWSYGNWTVRKDAERWVLRHVHKVVFCHEYLQEAMAFASAPQPAPAAARSDLKQIIDTEFDRFFEFPTADRSQVSSVSCKLFAQHIVGKLGATTR